MTQISVVVQHITRAIKHYSLLLKFTVENHLWPSTFVVVVVFYIYILLTSHVISVRQSIQNPLGQNSQSKILLDYFIYHTCTPTTVQRCQRVVISINMFKRRHRLKANSKASSPDLINNSPSTQRHSGHNLFDKLKAP